MRSFIILSSVVLLSFSIPSFAQRTSGPPARREDVAARQKFEYQMLANPKTGIISTNMRAKELKYAATLPAREDEYAAAKGTTGALSTPPVDWQSRGPENVGGRTCALGIDINNENIINAGSTSGGMWHSTDGGGSWVRTTQLDQIDNISALVQDPRFGKTNIWYCATGEPVNASVSLPLLGAQYIGNGIFKSTDDGLTWNILRSTVSTDSASLSDPFNWVCQMVIDTSHPNDVLYAATLGGIERSTDDGQTWRMTLGSFSNASDQTGVAVSTKGVVYAVLSGDKAQFAGPAETYGVFRSTDGIHWTNITPSEWLSSSLYVYLAMAPSNQNVLYFSLANQDRISFQFWEYTYQSGDGTASGGLWENRTQNLIDAGVQIPYDGVISVLPNDANTVFLGSVYLWRSTDGFATSNNIANLNRYYSSYDLHVDIQAYAFFPSNPSEMIVGCDGGLYITDDDLGDQVQWLPLDNNYVTTQFLSIALDHYIPGDVSIMGGSQDNGTRFTTMGDEGQPWVSAFGGDGMASAIAGDRNLIYASAQYGVTYEESYDPSGNLSLWTRLDPTGGGPYPWQNPFELDPTNSDRIYFGGGQTLWRNSNLASIPLNYDTGTCSTGWENLTATQLPANAPFGTYSAITAIGISTANPVNRVYYGTNDGMLFRLDNASTGNRAASAIWENKGFPQQAFVSSISVDPNNADSVIVSFANFEVQSLFLTTNGGVTWQPIGGNLEELPDGSGNGPSVRAAAILPTPTGNVYLVGTSTGVYSTTKLNGMQTVWSLEGASVIGNDIINALDVRPSDGYVAVGSCGSGAFTATITSATGAVRGSENAPTALTIEPNYPNPYSSVTHFEFKVAEAGDVSFGIYDTRGILVKQLVSKVLNAGTYTTEWNSSGMPSGVYLAKLNENGQTISRMISCER